jgi:hypothetical protein
MEETMNKGGRALGGYSSFAKISTQFLKKPDWQEK